MVVRFVFFFFFSRSVREITFLVFSLLFVRKSLFVTFSVDREICLSKNPWVVVRKKFSKVLKDDESTNPRLMVFRKFQGVLDHCLIERSE